jgi:multidrug resistance protein, MATE family
VNATTSFKEINRLAIPAIIAGIAEPLISLADTSIIGHLGTMELSAVGISSSFYLTLIWVLSQTKSAISSIVSIYFGKNKMSDIDTLIPQSVLLNFGLGVFILLLTFPFARIIFEFYGAQGEVLENSILYFQIRALGFPLALATFGVFGIFRGIQNTSWSMQISIVGGLINLLFDIILVYGIKDFIPSMGIAGAAIASLFAQFIMLILSIFYLVKKTNFELKLKFPWHHEIFNMLKMSIDLFIRTISLNVAYFLGTYFSTKYGNSYVAAHTIAMNIWLFSAFFIDGYSNAGSAISGKLLGENNILGLKKLVKDIIKAGVMVGIGLGFIYALGYFYIGSFFTQDEEVLLIFNSIFWLVIITQPFNGLAFGFDGIFKGIGGTKYLRNTLIIATFTCFVPIAFLGDFLGWKLFSIWIAFNAWMMMRGGLLYLNFKQFLKTQTTLQ